MGPVVRVGEAQVRALIAATVAATSAAGDLGEAAAGRVAPGDVEVDLHRAAGPAGLGLADRLAGGRPAVRRLRRRQQAEVDQRLAGVDGQELRREAVVGGDERRRVLAHQLAGQGQRLVGLLVGGADEALAGLDPAVRDAVEVDVVVRRVGVAVGERRRDEAEELVLELVGRRHARPAAGRAGRSWRRTRASGGGRSTSRGPARRRSPR